jgi:hypothetical protein
MNWKNKYTLSSYSKKNYKIFTIVCFLVFALIIDTLIVSVPDFLQDRIVSSPGIALFIMIAASYVAGQYFILHFIKQKTKDIRSKSIQLNTTHLVVTAVQYTLIAIFGLVILEILITNQYHITSLIAATLISYALNVVLLILFAK